eukprot:gene36443-biopygen28480
MAKTTQPKKTDAEQVADFMAALEHPLKAELEAVRQIILNAGVGLSERIKWNAPSYHFQDSPLLEGDYKDRRMVYFNDMADVQAKRPELERILQACVAGLA